MTKITTECFEKLQVAVEDICTRFGDCNCECSCYLSRSWREDEGKHVSGLWVSFSVSHRDSAPRVDRDISELEWLRNFFWDVAKILSVDGTGNDIDCRLDNISGLSIRTPGNQHDS